MNSVPLQFFTVLVFTIVCERCESVDNTTVSNTTVSNTIVSNTTFSGTTFSNSATSKNGSTEEPRDGGRVINGLPGEITTYPYVVEIQHLNTTGNFWYFRCVGTIMTPNTILTACHCIREAPFTNDNIKFKDLKDVRVLAGITNRYSHSKAQIATVKEFLPHPQCKSPPEKGYNTDVAVIILASDFDMTSASVEKVKIFSKDPIVAVQEQNRLVESGAHCVSMGWGLTEAPPSTKSLDILQFTTLRLINSKECSQIWCKANNYYCKDDLDQYNYVCAVNANSTMCRGDSGGPLICNDYLFGVDNLGDEKCRYEVPTIFADMNSILYFVAFF